MFTIHIHNDPVQPSYYRCVLPYCQCVTPLQSEGIQLTIGPDLPDEAHAYLIHYVRQKEVWDKLEKTDKKIIFSLDDHLWEVPKWNPYHEKYQDKSKINWLRDRADHIWVSTEPLRAAVDRPCRVLPNLLDKADWPVVERPRNEQVRLLWAGSAFHEPDLEIVGQVYDKLLARYSDVVCLFFGSWPTSTSEWVRLKGSNYGTLVPAARYGGRLGYAMPVVNTEYPGVLVNLNPDICLAALEDSPFARCKSNLKWMEYSMTGAVTVASDLPPYQGQAVCGDLYSLCCRLIEDEAERVRLGDRARETVLRDWTWQGPRKELWLQAFRAVAQ